LTSRRAGLDEQELAAAMACGTCILGATTGPLDGRALTHEVDARAGEGPAVAPLSFTGYRDGAPLWLWRLLLFLVERKG
jgi:hypothetical protein